MSAVFCQSLVWDQKWVMGRLKLALKLLSRKNWCQNSSAMLCWKTPGLAAGWMWAKDFHTSLLGELAYHSEHGVEINSFQFRFIVLRGGKFLKPRVKKKKKEHQYVNKSTYGKKVLSDPSGCVLEPQTNRWNTNNTFFTAHLEMLCLFLAPLQI